MNKQTNLITFIEEANKDLTKNTKEIELNEENNVTELHIHKILFIVYGSFYKNLIKICLVLISKLENMAQLKLTLEKILKNKIKHIVNLI